MKNNNINKISGIKDNKLHYNMQIKKHTIEKTY